MQFPEAILCSIEFSSSKHNFKTLISHSPHDLPWLKIIFRKNLQTSFLLTLDLTVIFARTWKTQWATPKKWRRRIIKKVVSIFHLFFVLIVSKLSFNATKACIRRCSKHLNYLSVEKGSENTQKVIFKFAQ